MPNVADRLLGATSTLGCKAPVQAATTANITLSGEQTVDGIALTEGDRCLVKDQTDATENGLYEVATSAWALAKDFDGTGDWRKGTIIPVAAGTVNVGTVWRVSSADPDSIGEDDVTFAQLDFTSVEVSDSVATGSSINLNSVDAEIVNITGSGATIATISVADGVTKIVRFAGANTLTHSSTLVLPEARNVTTAAGDLAIFCGFASSVVRCIAYTRSDGGFSTSTTDVGTTTAETDLVSHTIPAGRLAANGEFLRATAWGTITTASTAVTRRIRMYLDGTTIADSAAIAQVGGTWRINGVGIRESSTGAETFGEFMGSTGGTPFYTGSRTFVQTTLGSSVELKVTGLCTASSGIITLSGFVVDYGSR